MTASADPCEPVITSETELRAALAQRFLDNAAAGRDDANDALVEQLGTWRRQRNTP